MAARGSKCTSRPSIRSHRGHQAAVSIPVLANGDVTSADGALTLLKETGCDGVMIGRGALGDPWLFAQVRAALLGEERPSRR